jgi:dihydroorotate dehydrogenase
MSLGAALYPILKPLLFRLDAEVAHEWTTRLMVLTHRLGMLGREAVADGERVSVLGLSFPNRVGLAAGMDKSAKAVEAWSALGFGAVEVGTLTPRAQPGNAKPRLFRLPEHEGLINRMGFNNPGIDAAVGRLRKRRCQAVVGVNIGKNFDTPNERAVEDYLYGLKAAYEVADYVAVNISSPNTKGLRDLQGEEAIRLLLGRLQEEQSRLQGRNGRRVPMLVKIAPDLTEEQVEALARVFNELGVDGVIATNTTIGRAGVVGHPLEGEAGGLSGAPVLQGSNAVLGALRQRVAARIPLIGVGGILGAAEALEKRRLGAELVQVYSGLVFRGPRLLAEVSAALQ